MSAVLNTQKNYQSGFYLEKPTQSQNKKLLIEQVNDELKISIQENGNVFQVKKSMIDGLPKRDYIPKKFFDFCYCQVSATSNHVDFKLPLKGGGNNISTIVAGPIVAPVVAIQMEAEQIEQRIKTLEDHIEQINLDLEELKNEAADKKRKLNAIIKNIQNLSEQFVIYSHEYNILVDSFKEIELSLLNEQLENCNSQSDFILNIRSRINLIKQNRINLGELKAAIAKIEINLTSTKASISTNVCIGEPLDKELDHLHIKCKNISVAANVQLQERNELHKKLINLRKTAILPLFPALALLINDNYFEKTFYKTQINVVDLPGNISESKVWLEKTKDILLKIKNELERVNKKIVENEKLSSDLEELLYKMIMNESALKLRNIKEIGIQRLKQILINNDFLSLYASSSSNALDF